MVTQKLAVPAARAFDFLRDPASLGGWSLGCFEVSAVNATGLHTGHSLFDGGQAWFRIDFDVKRLTIDYLVGTPNALSRRISVRVLPGTELAYSPDTCLVTMTAWRPSGMGKLRWRQLCACHEAEIFLIKAQIENLPAPSGS